MINIDHFVLIQILPILIYQQFYDFQFINLALIFLYLIHSYYLQILILLILILSYYSLQLFFLIFYHFNDLPFIALFSGHIELLGPNCDRIHYLFLIFYYQMILHFFFFGLIYGFIQAFFDELHNLFILLNKYLA